MLQKGPRKRGSHGKHYRMGRSQAAAWAKGTAAAALICPHFPPSVAASIRHWLFFPRSCYVVLAVTNQQQLPPSGLAAPRIPAAVVHAITRPTSRNNISALRRISSTSSGSNTGAAASSFAALLLNKHDVAEAPPGRLSAAAKAAASHPRIDCDLWSAICKRAASMEKALRLRDAVLLLSAAARVQQLLRHDEHQQFSPQHKQLLLQHSRMVQVAVTALARGLLRQQQHQQLAAKKHELQQDQEQDHERHALTAPLLTAALHAFAILKLQHPEALQQIASAAMSLQLLLQESSQELAAAWERLPNRQQINLSALLHFFLVLRNKHRPSPLLPLMLQAALLQMKEARLRLSLLGLKKSTGKPLYLDMQPLEHEQSPATDTAAAAAETNRVQPFAFSLSLSSCRDLAGLAASLQLLDQQELEAAETQLQLVEEQEQQVALASSQAISLLLHRISWNGLFCLLPGTIAAIVVTAVAQITKATGIMNSCLQLRLRTAAARCTKEQLQQGLLLATLAVGPLRDGVASKMPSVHLSHVAVYLEAIATLYNVTNNQRGAPIGLASVAHDDSLSEFSGAPLLHTHLVKQLQETSEGLARRLMELLLQQKHHQLHPQQQQEKKDFVKAVVVGELLEGPCDAVAITLALGWLKRPPLLPVRQAKPAIKASPGQQVAQVLLSLSQLSFTPAHLLQSRGVHTPEQEDATVAFYQSMFQLLQRPLQYESLQRDMELHSAVNCLHALALSDFSLTSSVVSCGIQSAKPWGQAGEEGSPVSAVSTFFDLLLTVKLQQHVCCISPSESSGSAQEPHSWLLVQGDSESAAGAPPHLAQSPLQRAIFAALSRTLPEARLTVEVSASMQQEQHERWQEAVLIADAKLLALFSEAAVRAAFAVASCFLWPTQARCSFGGYYLDILAELPDTRIGDSEEGSAQQRHVAVEADGGSHFLFDCSMPQPRALRVQQHGEGHQPEGLWATDRCGCIYSSSTVLKHRLLRERGLFVVSVSAAEWKAAGSSEAAQDLLLAQKLHGFIPVPCTRGVSRPG
ncbi:hypothetical protein cyc_04800 [Cyclospora cayetanensis]|uniref:RAP domain-containing protein n=1 Tax=Cyclospora cayetanensis TaxID=88456 RepID=A0A1D3CW30_9EIME|nr:hypothetical protein cyc_04800 [Cyclospora cayetanensis]